MKTLNEVEIAELYEIEPNLDDPNYPKTILNIEDGRCLIAGEGRTLIIDVDGVEYICVTEKGKKDVWYL